MPLSIARSHRLPAYLLLLSMTVWFSACAETTIDRTSWIQIGQTTKAEVIAQYGEPDLVLTEQEGETVIYRPTQRVAPPVQIPTATPGPLGTTMTQMQTVEPGLGKNNKVYQRPQKETRIRYDARGIVQEVLQ